MPIDTSRSVIDTLSREIFERGVRYYLPTARLIRTGSIEPVVPRLITTRRGERDIEFTWLGDRYRLEQSARSYTEAELRLLGSIGTVSLRYRGLIDSTLPSDRL